MKDVFQQELNNMREKVNSTPEDKKPFQALLYIGILLDTLLDYKKQGQFLNNSSNSEVKKFCNELSDVAKNYICNTYIKDFDEEKAKRADFCKLYNIQKQDIEDAKDKDNQIKLVIMGRTYAIHKLFGQFEKPQATKLYYEIVG